MIQDNNLPLGTLIRHPVHGVGYSAGKVTLKINGEEKEYFALDYTHGDKLYVPLERLGTLEVVSKGRVRPFNTEVTLKKMESKGRKK